MDVLALAERVEQAAVARDVGHDPQLDLRVVRRHDPVPGRRDEGLADAAALGRADRDVLQVGIARRQAPGDGDRLPVVCVHPAVRIGHRGQLVAVGGLQLRQAAVLEQHLRQREVLGQLLEHLLVGRRRAARRLLHHRQAELAEQDLADLLRAAEVERLPRRFLRPDLQFGDARAEFAALRAETLAVDQHPAALHLVEHLRGRQLDVLVDVPQRRLRLDARPQRAVQLERHLGVLRRVLRRAVERDLVEAQLVGALAAHLGVGQRPALQVALRERVHVVAAMRLQHVRLQQGVVRDARQANSVVREHVHVVLQVLAHLAVVRALEPRFQCVQRLLERQLLRRPRVAVRQRDVAGLERFDRQRQADQSRRERIERCRLGVDAREFGRADPAQPVLQLLARQHRFVLHVGPRERPRAPPRQRPVRRRPPAAAGRCPSASS